MLFETILVNCFLVKQEVGAVKRKIVLLAMLLSVFLLSAMAVQSLSAIDWTVGVKVGDWFRYEGSVDYEADEGVPFPPDPTITYLVPFNETDWFRFNVTDVDGTNITFEGTYHWENDTETTSTFVENIAATSFHAIGANMSVGDQVAAAGGFLTATIIDETIDMEYENVTRETNHARANVTAVGADAHYDWWWDKETGMQVKVIDHGGGVFAQGNASWVANATLVETNIWDVPEGWDIPEFHPWTFMLLIVTASTITLVLYKRRRLFIKT